MANATARILAQPLMRRESGPHPSHYVDALEKKLLTCQEQLTESQQMLEAIQASHGWKLLRLYYAVRNRLLPPSSFRLRLAKAAIGRLRRLGAPLRLAGIKAFCRTDYDRWIAANEPRTHELAGQRATSWPSTVTISIVTPTWETSRADLNAILHSVRGQTYPHWELCIADGGSKDPGVEAVLERHVRADHRIKIVYLPEDRGIAGNTAAALALTTGEFVAFLDQNDLLAPFALFEVASTIHDNADADLLYSDEDKIDDDRVKRTEPHFKPDWSPDLLRSFNYITHLAVFRRSLVERVGGIRPGFDGAEDYDLVLRASEQARKIIHIPKVLYHRRGRAHATASSAGVEEFAVDAAERALREHLERSHIDGRVIRASIPGTFHCSYALPTRPLVSIIIPTCDQVPLLARCLDSIGRTEYDHYEILVVENNSREPATFDYYRKLTAQKRIRLLTWDQPFNYAAANNFAVERARGEILLFLNNDIEVINADWLERLLEHALRPEVGAVGGKLYYTDGTIQHAGVVVGLGGVAGHIHCNFPGNAPGYFLRLTCQQNLSAITGACLMTRREVFEDVDGFDPGFVLAYNDIDLCVRIREEGYLIIWTPRAELFHHESATRGFDDTPEKLARYRREVNRFQIKCEDILRNGDPYYNQNLTHKDLDFSLRL